VTPLSNEHQLNRLIFDDIELFMSRQSVPPVRVPEQPTPIPFIATVDDIEVAFIAMIRRTSPTSVLALVIQYSVRAGGAVVASMIRNMQNPIYGLMHFRPEIADDLAYLQNHLTGPLAYRLMTDDEIKHFAVDMDGMTKKQIRLRPAD